MRRVGEAQNWVVARDQLHELGYGSGTIRCRVAKGLLHPVLPRAFAVGRAELSEAGWWTAGVFAGGPGAALSDGSAAAAWDLMPAPSRPVHVCTLGRRQRRHPDLVAHRPRELLERDLTLLDGLPVTSVARTCLDLAARLSDRQLRRALERVQVLRIYDHEALLDVLARAGGHRGSRRLRRCLPDSEPPVTRSELERLFVALCRRYGIAIPQLNVTVGGFEVDAYWPRARLIVELDGFRYHGSFERFEADRRRDGALSELGLEVLRLSYAMVTRDAPQTAAMLKKVLEQRGLLLHPIVG